MGRLKQGGENLPPRWAKIALGILTPRAIEKEFINDFDELYANWAVPTYGSLAPVWAWGQVIKTAAILAHEVTLEFWGKARRKAR